MDFFQNWTSRRLLITFIWISCSMPFELKDSQMSGSWIHACLSTIKLSSLINGAQGSHFKVYKGLEQGCPLSSLRFIIAVDIFDSIIKRAIECGFLEGMANKSCSWSVPNLHLPDDILLFCFPKVNQAVILKIILYGLALVRGLKINFAKSSLIYIKENEERKLELAQLLNCSTDSLPFKYPGLPISDRRLRKEDWNKIIEKVDRRMAGWKGKTLSISDQLTLVNSIFSTILSYYRAFYFIPSWDIRKIDSI